MRTLTLLALLPLITLGCEEADPQAVGLGDVPADVTVRSYLAPDDRPTTQAERFALHDASSDALADVRATLRTSTGWAEADARLRALVSDQADPLRRRETARVAATYMLQPGVLPGDDPAVLDAKGRYVEVLAEVGTLDAPLVAGALTELQGHWSEARVARMAATVAETVERHAIAQADCDGCSVEEASRLLGARLSGDQAAFVARSAEAARALRALAE